jgi:hypothetical protein
VLAASVTVGSAGTLESGCCSRCVDVGHDLRFGEWGDFGGTGHPAGEVSFEGLLIGVAAGGGTFAGYFVHNIILEENATLVKETRNTGLPSG